MRCPFCNREIGRFVDVEDRLDELHCILRGLMFESGGKDYEIKRINEVKEEIAKLEEEKKNWLEENLKRR